MEKANGLTQLKPHLPSSGIIRSSLYTPR